jgi:hypothetical protein
MRYMVRTNPDGKSEVYDTFTIVNNTFAVDFATKTYDVAVARAQAALQNTIYRTGSYGDLTVGDVAKWIKLQHGDKFGMPLVKIECLRKHKWVGI